MFKWLIPFFGYAHRCKKAARLVFERTGGGYDILSGASIRQALNEIDGDWAGIVAGEITLQHHRFFTQRQLAKWIYDNNMRLPEKL